MDLFKQITLLELRRLRTSLALLFLTVLMSSYYYLSPSDSSMTEVKFQVFSDGSEAADLDGLTAYLELLPSMGLLIFPLLVGLAFVLIAPWRNDNELREGLLQMFKLSCYSMLHIVAARYIFQLSIVLVYFCLITISYYFSHELNDQFAVNFASDASASLSYLCISFVIFFLPLGHFTDAVRLAYRDGSSRFLTGLLPMLMWLFIALFILRSAAETAGSFLPAYVLNQSQVHGLGDSLSLYFEPLLVMGLCGILLIFLAGRITSEIEL